jgi:hypothetical protein
MSDEPEEPEEDHTQELLDHFSNEYAEALRAFETINAQTETLLLMGGGDDLRQFLEQFLGMAERTRLSALENDQPRFAELFVELSKRAESLLAQIAAKEPESEH